LIKYFERLPDDQISKLLTYMKNSTTRIILFKLQADLPVKVDVNKLLKDDFQLNSDSESEKDRKRKKRESKEKECKCCKQVVRRHHCQHTLCSKPCIAQEKKKKP